MGLIEWTSNASLWRGYDYYEKKKVKDALLELLFTGPEWQYDRFVRSLDL